MQQNRPDKPDAKAMGRRERKALAVRRALFDAGLKAFDRQPIGLVSVLDITELADVAKGVFYLQFRSKDEYLLSLWADAQQRFLGLARAAAASRRSQSGRIEAAVTTLLTFSAKSPAATRFWLRMAGFFPDEIGEPDQLARLQQEYTRQLAGVIAAKATDKVSRQDMVMAQLVDSFCWAAIHAEQQTGQSIIDAQGLCKVVRVAVATLRDR